MSKSLRMTLYDFALSGRRFSLSGPGRRFIYVAQGRLLADGETYEVDDGFFAAETTTIEGEGLAWIYEVAPLNAGLLQDGALSLVMSRHAQPPTDAPRLMRADRIESPSGVATPRHGHRGPGLRRLVYGRLMAEIGEDFDRIDPGRAWFETGHDPVVGTNISGGSSAFVRVMVLPPDLTGGKSSFVPVSPEDARKPRSVTNRLFDEVMLDF